MHSIHKNKIDYRFKNSHLKILYFTSGPGYIWINNKKIRVDIGAWIGVKNGVCLRVEDSIEFYIIYFLPELLDLYLNFLKSKSKSFHSSIARSERKKKYCDYTINLLSHRETLYLNRLFSSLEEWSMKSSYITILFINHFLSSSLIGSYREFVREEELEKVGKASGEKDISFPRDWSNKISKDPPISLELTKKRESQISKGLDLLESSSLTVKKIATLCDFNSSSYFIKLIKEKTGVTPLSYRRSFRKNLLTSRVDLYKTVFK